MASLHKTTIQSGSGVRTAAFSLRPIDRASPRPVVLFLHGSLRNSAVLQAWADPIDPVADAVFFDLPGHGQSDAIADMSVRGIATHVAATLRAALGPRRVVLVGESLGGTVAFAVAGMPAADSVAAVLAADPPLTTAKLWSVAQAHLRRLHQLPADHYLHGYADKVFGLTRRGLEERIYYPLLGDLRIPTVIAAGDTPLFPPRNMDGSTTIFDAVDEFVTRNLYPGRIEIERIANCGHLVLVEAAQASLAIIMRLLAAHAPPAPAAT
ncbi:MAG: alpha/beta fold hydrolase [Phenylobacterium sp.]|uniref:alpha/beta fold hydrolase n=1 Tax=Phenylobacterium sp. TaxID=1871053 RepID=UPI0025F50CA1|nr:alpha/beta fold hydrolase [Phenylobacterium sp.]MBI1198284.1 alpha/beta fold hydrolase [Phenylobacterium sp.]